jgi:hypothetical protein
MNESVPTPPAGDPQWAIIYLREDIQDLRQEVRQNRQETHQGFQHVNNRIDTRFTLLMVTMIGLSGILAGLIKF